METEKQMLLKQIAEMEQREKDNQKTLEEMRKKVEKLEEEQPTVSATGVYYQIEPNTKYYSINAQNRVYELNANYLHLEQVIGINTCFATEQQAEQEALRREGQEFIRRCAMLWNKDHDWRKKIGTSQFTIVFTYFMSAQKMINMADGCIYFDTEELAEKCIKELKAKYNEEQIKTIFGVK